MRLKRQLRITFLTAVFFFGLQVGFVYAGTLSCVVATTCVSGVVIYRMQNTANGHAELPSQAAYTQLVCCSGVAGLGNACSGTFATALKLSGTTNAHAEQNSQINYANSACIQAPSGGSVSVGYQATNCTGFDTTLGSMSATTNAHVGDGAAYTTKICATAAASAPSLTFIVSTDTFPTLSPGTPRFATTTLNVNTANSTGWNVTLSGDNTGSLAASTTMYLSPANYSTSITDQTQWVPGAATTSAGNAARISSLINSAKVLAFRTMTASGTMAFRVPSWWGVTDAYIDSATALWAGVASSSVARQIGNSSVSSGGGDALSTVLYYLDVASTQQGGSYTGNLTFTATMNP